MHGTLQNELLGVGDGVSKSFSREFFSFFIFMTIVSPVSLELACLLDRANLVLAFLLQVGPMAKVSA